MRLAHLAPTFWHPRSALGGAERYVSALARAQAARHEVRLISFVGGEGEHGREGDLEWIAFPRGRRAAANPLAAYSAAALRASRGAEILHVHQVYTPLAARAVAAGRLGGSRVVITDHNGGAPLGLLGRLLVRHAHAYGFVSDLSRRQFPWVSASRAVVIGAGVDPEAFRPAERPSRDYVLFVGRPLLGKGLDVLLRAAGSSFRLVLALATTAGLDPEGVERNLATSGRRPEVIWNPEPADLLRLYGNAAVLALPSTSLEVVGLVALEALACGTPVVVTSLCGVAELFGGSEAARVVPPGDADALRLAIRELTEEKTLPERAEAARSLALRNTWAVVADRCEEVYRKVIGDRSWVMSNE